MKVSRVILQQAVDLKIINSGQAEALFELIKNQPEQESAFNLTNVLYYFGGSFFFTSIFISNLLYSGPELTKPTVRFKKLSIYFIVCH